MIRPHQCCLPLVWLAACVVCSDVGAATSLRLPTDGYVRLGRYFPVEVRTDTPARVALRGVGCLPCDAAVDGRTTVPVLAVSTPAGLSDGGASVPLRVPADDERLVASTAELPAAAGGLFPNARLIPIRLDPADPLPGPAAAWEVLDAVLLDPAAMTAVTDARRSTLLAGGVMLAVAAEAPPDGRWPWRRRGPLWVLAYAPSGPADLVVPEAYVPTEAWTPGWPGAVRGAAAAIALLLCCTTVGCLIVAGRPRHAVAPHLHARLPRGARRAWVRVAVPVALSAAAVVGTVAWRATLDPVARAGGDVTVTDGRWWQRDGWVFDRARSAADLTVPWAGGTHPVFASTSAMADDGPRLTVAADGRLAFAMHLSAGAAMAFVRRDVEPAGTPPRVTDGRGAAMRDMAPLYLSSGDRVAGDTAAPTGRWPGVWVVRR